MGIFGILFGQTRTVIDENKKSLGGLIKNASSKSQSLIKQWNSTRTTVGIVLDALVSEEFSSKCDVTEYPVESGAVIADHVQMRPIELTIQGVITDSPLGYAVIGNIQNLVRSVSTLFGQTSRSIDAFNELLELQKKRIPFTVVTGLRRYENMIMTELTVPRTAQTGGAIHFSATMKEVKIVSSQHTNLKLSSSVAKLGAKITDLGGKTTQTTPWSAAGNAANKGAAQTALDKILNPL